MSIKYKIERKARYKMASAQVLTPPFVPFGGSVARH